MKAKKVIIFVVAAMLAFALCACSSGSADLTAEEIVAKTEEACKDMSSTSATADFTMKMSTSAVEQSFDMSMKMAMDVIIQPEMKAKVKSDIVFSGQTTSMEMYMMPKDGKFMAYTNADGTWFATEIATEEEYKALIESSSTSMLDYVGEGNSITKQEDQKVDDIDCYVLTLNISPKALDEAMSAAGSEAASISDMLGDVDSIPMTLYVNKSDFSPVQIEMDMVELMNKAITSQLKESGLDAETLGISFEECSMIIKYTNFNSVESIELPAEAESAQVVTADDAAASEAPATESAAATESPEASPTASAAA